jgi:hypothetical protein
MKVILPLFPSYLFVHINFTERVKVLQSPGVLQIVGNGKEYAAGNGSNRIATLLSAKKFALRAV